MGKTLIKNVRIVNEGITRQGAVLVDGNVISDIFGENTSLPDLTKHIADNIIDGDGGYLIPGVIDAHVHFREPGLTQKADIYHESRAAVAGGTTSFMDMPNTKPQTVTIENVKEKIEIAKKKSIANYSFYLGLTNDNIDEATSIDSDLICGLKLFLGSSTGNMLVNNKELLEKLFKLSKRIISVHSEDDNLIKANTERIKAEYADKQVPISLHPTIRSEEACVKATKQVIQLARQYNTRLHILHISTAKELEFFDKGCVDNKRITAETCPQYMNLNDEMYETLGAKMKCNPAIKTHKDQEALIKGIMEDKIDTIGTDHAPHLLADKKGDCLHATSGTPQIQYGLLLHLEMIRNRLLTIEKVVEKTSHNVAKIFGIKNRGFIKKGYYADLVLVKEWPLGWTITNDDVISKCGWTPYAGMIMHNKIAMTMVNGSVVYQNEKINETGSAMKLEFNL